MWEAIKTLRVRGAPAIGIAAAYGVVLGTQQASAADTHTFLEVLDQVSRYLESSRPTAVNLFWAIRRMRDRAHQMRREKTPPEIHAALLDEARAIHEEDRQTCRAIGAQVRRCWPTAWAC